MSSIVNKTKSDLTILLIGDSGVGKSTAINGFDCYLRFNGLTDAEDAVNSDRFVLPIQSTIEVPVVDEENGKDIGSHQVSTGTDPNEKYGTPGESVTQFPQVHTFDYEGLSIRIVDTPGLNDTRGQQQDDRNLEYILAELAELGKFDAIVILLNPDIKRSNPAFVGLLKKVLGNLHESAKNNIVFLFTNASQCRFKPAGTLPLLQRFLKDNHLESINVTTEKIFFVDNLAVPYLVKLKGKIAELEDERDDADGCWKKSEKEILRLLTYASSLAPVEVDGIVALHRAKQTIAKVSEPLLHIACCIGKNDFEIQQKCRDIERKCEDLKRASTEERRAALTKMAEELKVKTYHLKTKTRDHWSLVCNTCVTDEHGHKIRKTCQEHVTAAVYFPRCCEVMSWGKCQKCSCSHTNHELTKTILSVKEKETVNLDTLAKLLTLSSSPTVDPAEAVKVLESEIGKLKTKADEYRREQEVIIQKVAKLTVFHLDNSLISEDLMQDRILRFISEQIDLAEKLVGAEGNKLSQALERMQNDYRIALSKERSEDNKLSVKGVLVLIESMYILPTCGEQLSEAMQQVNEITRDRKPSGLRLKYETSKSQIGRLISSWALRQS